jgi:hypothetical protein
VISTWSQLPLPPIVTGRVLAIVPVALRFRPVTTPSMIIVTIEAVRSQRTVCQLPSLTLTVDPAEAALLPAEPRNRQTILPLGCSNFQYPPLEPAWPFWTTLPKEWVVRIRNSIA